MFDEFTIRIDGREAIPVRAIPYIATYCSADYLARKLSRSESAVRDILSKTFAYRYYRTKPPGRLEPMQWEAITDNLKALNGKLKEGYANDDIAWREWREKSVLELPASVFLWLDEFIEDIPMGAQSRHAHMTAWALMQHPLWSDDTRKMVFEGFENYRLEEAGEASANSNAPKAAPAESKPQSEVNAQVSPRTIQTQTTKRSNALTAVIASAAQSAQDPADYQSVWAELVKLADSQNRPAPLLGFVEAEGVKYQADNGVNGVKFFTKRNLSDRMRRAK